MIEFIHGKDLCRSFFKDYGEPVLREQFPELLYTAGLIGYGSDVLGYDDPVSTDHMWGPRFYVFLKPGDMYLKDDLYRAFGAVMPHSYKGFCVSFSEPDPDDHGVRHPEPQGDGPARPLIFIQTISDFLLDRLGTVDVGHIEPLQWLVFSEHRLLSIAKGELYHDDLDLKSVISKFRFYPENVKRYLLASGWDILSSEQAFVKRCVQTGDDLGSRIICARMAERIMRQCFLYLDTYAPYSKWFGRAFQDLPVSEELKEALNLCLTTNDGNLRAMKLAEAQALAAEVHNRSGLTEPVDYRIENYFTRDIPVIFPEKFAEALKNTLAGTAFEKLPLIGSLSQQASLSNFSDGGSEAKILDNLKRLTDD